MNFALNLHRTLAKVTRLCKGDEKAGSVGPFSEKQNIPPNTLSTGQHVFQLFGVSGDNAEDYEQGLFPDSLTYNALIVGCATEGELGTDCYFHC